MKEDIQTNNKEKAFKLSEMIKIAYSSKKYKKGGLGKYLASDNEDYVIAIELVSGSANLSEFIMIMNCILSAAYMLVAYGITMKPNDFSIKPSVDVSIIIPLSFLSLTLSITGFILAKKIKTLSVPPSTIRSFFIMILLFDAFPIIVSFMFGNIVIPSGLNLLMIIYVFSALSRMSTYKKWFSEYTVKPVRIEKKSENQKSIERISPRKESDDYYDDGL